MKIVLLLINLVIFIINIYSLFYFRSLDVWYGDATAIINILVIVGSFIGMSCSLDDKY